MDKIGETRIRSGKRAVGYIRVSDDSQIEGYSLDAQKAEIEHWCKRRGYTLIKVYVEAGVTAHSDRIERRPQLAQLLKEAEQNQFDIVLVHSLCRWARRLRIQITALEILSKAKVDFVSVTEAFDSTTHQGRLMLNQMGCFNEYFSDQLGEHVKKAFRLKANSGLTVGPVSFAYRYQEKGLPPAKVDNEA
jgi:site-specific DNA recombinase